MSKSPVDNINSPAYLSHYGMHRPPFAENLDDSMIFSDPAISQRLDILIHLTQYSKELLLVIGTEGVGKTTMLNQFLTIAGPTWKTCQVNGNPMLDEEQLLLHISHGFHLQVGVNGFDAALKNLKRRLEALLATTQTVVLMIDDAHQLNDTVLNLVLELSNINHTGSGGKIRTILFAESSIQNQLATPELETHLKDQPIRKIDLPPYTEEQAQAYIQYRLSQSGISPETALSQAAINKIHRQSMGIARQINQHAHSALYDMTPLKELSEQAEHNSEDLAKSRKLVRFASAVVIGLGLLTLLLFQNEINDLYSISNNKPSIVKTEPDQKIIDLAIPVLAANNLAKNNNSSKQKNVTKTSKSNNRIDSVLDKIAKLNDQIQQDKPTRKIFKKADNRQVTKAGHVNSKASFIRNLTKVKTPNKKILSRKITWLSSINREAWIMAQDPRHFTLQLVAGYQRSSIDHFITLYPQLAANLGYFASLNRGRNWHSLVYGVYPNYLTAITAARDLTAILGKYKPWIRQIKSIQKDISS